MGKRKSDKLLSQSEIRQSAQHHYDGYIKESQKKQIAKQPRNATPASGTSSIIIRDPSANCARKCYQCDCTNDRGFCDNYHLYAVIRNICRVPVKGAVKDE
jgi:hypothetical protein